jgi:HK97 family phage major capsid protein
MTAVIATPSTPKEWEEYVHGFDTPEKFASAMADGSFKTALTSYGNAQNSVMADISAQVKEQAQLAVHDMLKRNGQEVGTAQNRLDLVDKARQKAGVTKALYNEKAPGAGLNGMFADIGEFVQCALSKPDRRTDETKEKFQTLFNYSEKVPSEGGVLVPEEFRSDILSVALEQAIVRPRATVVPMATGRLKYPAIDMTTEVGEVYGGIIFYDLDEGDTIPDTSAAFAALELVAHKLAAAAIIPNELMKDTKGALVTWLMTNLPTGFAHAEDVRFLKGNGVKKPLGALHADNPALISVAKESGQSAATITWNNVLAMFARMLPESFDSAVWVVTPDAIPELFTMALPVGTGGSAVMIGDGTQSAAQSAPLTLLGRPIKFSRKAPAVLGTQGDISLVDFSQYLIGDTQDLRLDTSEHAQFLSDKTVFRGIERIDGQPQQLSPLTPENGGPTLSSYVQLATRS